MQYSLDFKQVLSINERFLDGYESEHFGWSNWSRIDAYLKEARMQAVFDSVGRRHSAPPSAGKSGNPGDPPKAPAHIYGVPREFLTKNSLCIKWNRGECEETGASHKFGNTNTTLYHKCAACKKSGKTPEKEHAVRDCSSNQYKKKSFRE